MFYLLYYYLKTSRMQQNSNTLARCSFTNLPLAFTIIYAAVYVVVVVFMYYNG